MNIDFLWFFKIVINKIFYKRMLNINFNKNEYCLNYDCVVNVFKKCDRLVY